MHFINRPTSWVCAALAALLALSGFQPGYAQSVVLPSVADTYLRDATVRGGLGFMDVRGAAIDFRSYVRFDLSSIPAGSTITGATLQLTQVPGASRNDAIVAARLATYGLTDLLGNTPQNWDEATFVPALKGTEDVDTLTGVTDLDDNIAGITEAFTGATGATVVTISGAPLASFLQSRFDAGGLVTFILSNDDATDRGFGFGTKENADPLTAPILTVEYIPEPSALALIALSAVGLFRRRR
jgi:hypothetical protein